MRIVPCFKKTLKENIRDWKILILALVFAPFFIYLMYFYLDNPGSKVYKVVVLNNDHGDYSVELIKEWESLKSGEGKQILTLQIVTDTSFARNLIRNKDADLFVSIPYDFTASLNTIVKDRSGNPPSITNFGDQSNARFLIASSFIDYVTISYVGIKMGMEMPVDIEYKYAGKGRSVDEFSLYVPAMLVLSIIMMLFTAGASIVREIEKDTITRLRISNLRSIEFMGAMSLNQVIIGLACLLLTLLAAVSVGYRTSGSVLLLSLVGMLTCFSVISISIITSCFIRSMFGLLTLGCFPFFILMFFSDCFMPLPRINMFNLLGNRIYLNDLLPTATATRALNEILNYDSGLKEVLFEIGWIFVLSFIYFVLGTWLFRRKYRY